MAAYCRGPYCVHANGAVTSLRSRGIPAVRLRAGYPEWAQPELAGRGRKPLGGLTAKTQPVGVARGWRGGVAVFLRRFFMVPDHDRYTGAPGWE
jgi:hypothetical protein